MLDTCPYMFVQTHRMSNTQKGLNMHSGLLVAVMVHVGPSTAMNRLCSGHVENGGSCACVGRDQWEPSVAFLNFTGNLKLLQKVVS